MQCKNVISKLQRRIDKEGHQIVPLLTDLWKRIENSGYNSGSGNSLLDLRKIDQRIDRLEYNGATELVFDVQFMLKSAMQFYGFSHEVRFLTSIIVHNDSPFWLFGGSCRTILVYLCRFLRWKLISFQKQLSVFGFCLKESKHLDHACATKAHVWVSIG